MSHMGFSQTPFTTWTEGVVEIWSQAPESRCIRSIVALITTSSHPLHSRHAQELEISLLVVRICRSVCTSADLREKASECVFSCGQWLNVHFSGKHSAESFLQLCDCVFQLAVVQCFVCRLVYEVNARMTRQQKMFINLKWKALCSVWWC